MGTGWPILRNLATAIRQIEKRARQRAGKNGSGYSNEELNHHEQALGRMIPVDIRMLFSRVGPMLWSQAGADEGDLLLLDLRDTAWEDFHDKTIPPDTAMSEAPSCDWQSAAFFIFGHSGYGERLSYCPNPPAGNTPGCIVLLDVETEGPATAVGDSLLAWLSRFIACDLVERSLNRGELFEIAPAMRQPFLLDHLRLNPGSQWAQRELAMDADPEKYAADIPRWDAESKKLVPLAEAHVERLELQSHVGDLALLRGQIKLRDLTISRCALSDLSPIGALPNLEHVYFYQGSVEFDLERCDHVVKFGWPVDLSQISPHQMLQSVVLLNSAAYSLSAIAGFSVLTRLSLNQSGWNRRERLAVPSTVELFEANGSSLNDLEPLASLRRLKHVYVPQTRVPSVEPLADCTALEYLNICDTLVKDLRPLVRLPALRTLEIANDQIDPAHLTEFHRRRPEVKIESRLPFKPAAIFPVPAVWQFAAPLSQSIMVGRAVWEQGNIVKLVHHSLKGEWGFYSGTEDVRADIVRRSLIEVVEMDDSLSVLADLPRGWIAQRVHPNSPWQRQDRGWA